MVDLRQSSPTYGQKFSVILSEENQNSSLFQEDLHMGFQYLKTIQSSATSVINYYNKDLKGGIMYNDKELGINWMLKQEEVILSGKDQRLQTFKSLRDEV